MTMPRMGVWSETGVKTRGTRRGGTREARRPQPPRGWRGAGGAGGEGGEGGGAEEFGEGGAVPVRERFFDVEERSLIGREALGPDDLRVVDDDRLAAQEGKAAGDGR